MTRTQLEQRPSGIPSAGELPWGSHFGVLHDSQQDLTELLAPFLAAGLTCNELCWWEVRAPMTVEQATSLLVRAVPAFAELAALGKIRITAAPEASEGWRLDEAIERRLDQAILAGFDGLRLVLHATAATSGPALALLTESIRRLNVVAAVLYPRAKLVAADVMRVVQDHRFALVRNGGRWELLEGSEARSVRDALRRSEETLESLFSNMSEGFAYHRIVLDAQGTPCDYVFLEVNAAFEHQTGLAAREILGRRVTQVIPGIEKDPADWIGRYGRVALTGEPVQFESHAAALDRWYAASAFSSHKGYFAVTFSDITARKRSEEELSRANQRLQTLAQDLQTVNGALIDSDRRKNEFLAVLSHELRNPLAPIVNSLFLLEHLPPGSHKAGRAQQVIARQVGHLSHLVDDLLDVTRVSRNKIQLERRRVDLCDVIRRSVEDQRSLFEASGVQLESRIPAEPLFVNADATRVSQVVGNLLQNAVKFTPRGGFTRVGVSADHGRGQALVRVADTGVGMAPETLAGLFQPFMQADKTLDRSRGGLGLGLALVKGLVELHGGAVVAHSDGLGKGAEFVVTLPLDDTAQT